MCGIFGVILHGTKHLGKQDEIAFLFSSLAGEAAVRGTDATGLARVESDGYIYTYKNVVPSYEIVRFRRWWRPLGNIQRKTLAILGHTRFGTHGDNTIENAHPFMFTGSKQTIVGTHNGIISNYRQLGPEVPYDNDSANLFYRLAETPRSEWPAVLTKVSGSFALAWSDGKEMFLARNYGNPCVLMYLESIDATVYASTESILKQALADSVFPVAEIKALPPGAIYSWLPGHGTSVRTPFECESGTWGPYSRAAMAWGDEEAWENYPEAQIPQGKFLPRPKSTRTHHVMVCESCGKETDSDLMVYAKAINGYECRSCNSGTDARRICGWCKTETRFAKYNRDLNVELCASCYAYSGADPGKDSAVECGVCGNEYPTSSVNVSIFMNADAGDYCCEDCLTFLPTNSGV